MYKFVADDMLGKLAKYLRLLGYDATYLRHSQDKELVKIALDENRIILTRDRELSRIKKVKSVLIKSTATKKQLEEVKKALKIVPNKKNMFTRCSECNTETKIMKKDAIKDMIPHLVYEMYEEFRHCPKCNRVYWPGSHYGRILKEIT